MILVLFSLFALTFLGQTSSTTIDTSGEVMEGSYVSNEDGTVEITSSTDSNEGQSKAGLDDFVTCLEEKKAKFYGAFWCPHCQDQKGVFGISEKLLPYVECSTPDGSGQTDMCKEMQINTYPTWIFAGKDRLEGEQSLKQLAEKTGCELPATK